MFKKKTKQAKIRCFLCWGFWLQKVVKIAFNKDILHIFAKFFLNLNTQNCISQTQKRFLGKIFFLTKTPWIKRHKAPPQNITPNTFSQVALQLEEVPLLSGKGGETPSIDKRTIQMFAWAVLWQGRNSCQRNLVTGVLIVVTADRHRMILKRYEALFLQQSISANYFDSAL